MRRVLSLFAVIIVVCPSFAANLTYVRLDEPIVESRLALKPVDQAARLTMLRNQFLKAGCTPEQIREQPVPDQEQPNLICTLPGTEPGAIVIGARSDYQPKGDEAKVDWATLEMLPLLAESLYQVPHRYSFVFVAFTGHKDFAGSAAYVKSLSEEGRKNIRAMINLEQVGRTPATFAFATMQSASGLTPLGPTKQVTHDDTPMSNLLPLAAITLKLTDFAHLNRELMTRTDAMNFEIAGIQALTITSPSYTVLVRPGNTEVPMARTELDPKIYYQTYNLLCVYTLYLDRGIAPGNAKPGTEVAKAPVAPTPPDVKPPAAPVVSAPPAAPVTVANAPLPASTATRSTPAAQLPAPVFHSITRLVQVDVVVTDKAGNPVKGLSQSEFTVLQDGKPQPVKAFEVHDLSQAAQQARIVPKLPPNTYTNLPNSVQDQSWTIILYDQLNTPTNDQQVARQQLIKVLKTLPSGTPVALFMLGQQRLELLQGFNSDQTQIVRAAERIHPETSEMLTTHAEQQASLAQIASASGNAASSHGSPGIIGDQAYKDTEALRTNTRTLFTIDALEGIARAVSGYPGRKNLMWLSGSFPIRVEPDPTSAEAGAQFRNVRDYHERIAKADALLTESRVAVYAIDVRGLTTDLPDAVGLDERESLTQISYETGGHPFVGTNGFDQAIRKAMADGSIYYTVAYTPPPQKEKGEPYHQIEVKLNRKDVNLSYRRGYYSTPQQKPTAEQGTAALKAALQPGMPPSTMLYVMASVKPPSVKEKNVLIRYVISPMNVTFTDGPENKKQVVVDCMAIAFDQEGREVAHASDTLDGAIPQSAYEAVMQQGLPASQEIELRPGTYNLRLGVMDRATQQIGTVDVPLEIPAAAEGK